MRSKLIVLVLTVLSAGFAVAATPPSFINYQGVLRSASSAPLDGTFDMEFRFLSADVGGDEILIDRHTAAFGFAVAVSGGLFNVQLGGGSIVDGSGPGTYTDLGAVFRDYASVWLAARVGGEDLTPRVRVISAAYALNASAVEGKPGSTLLDTSATVQTKNGPLQAIAPVGITTGLIGAGTSQGGYFYDTNNSGIATIASGDYGVEGWGNIAGGYFADLNSTGYAYIATGDYGIGAYGSYSGGYFENSTSTGQAWVGFPSYGIWGQGSTSGGYFKDTNQSGYADVGTGDRGISAHGYEAGGYFRDDDNGTYAYVGYGTDGIDAYGSAAGGYFKDSDSSGYGRIGYGDYGVAGWGDLSGGFFDSLNGSAVAYAGFGDAGVWGSGYNTGGVFFDGDNSGYAYVGYGDRGIWGKGLFAGGTFSHPDNVTYWADVSRPSYKIYGTGSVAFVQNDPADPDRVIVYNAPEGDEVATYTRGSAQIHGGIARLPLEATFARVTNPDIGLTAHVTPRGQGASLYVESVTTKELVVRAEAGSPPDAAFDYLVYGLRIGFENEAVIQSKDREAPLPAQETFEAKLVTAPEARSTTALERFKGMTAALRGTSPDALDLTGTAALRAAIAAAGGQGVGRVDPDAERAGLQSPIALAAHPSPPQAEPSQATSVIAHGSPSVPSAAPVAPADAVAGGIPTSAATLAALARFPVSEAVEAGDLLVLDPEHPGALQRAAGAADPSASGSPLRRPKPRTVPSRCRSWGRGLPRCGSTRDTGRSARGIC